MIEAPPRASVIVPAYNAAQTIARAVESALKQTERSLEVLVIDDASTDATAAVIAQMVARDGRVRLLQQSVNRGPAAARNRGLMQAQGTWVALLDADDEYDEKRLETLLERAEDRSADIVADNLLLCPVHDRAAATPMIPAAILPAAKWMSAAEFVAGNIGSRRTPRVSYGFLQPLIRRSFLQRHHIRYDERNRFGEDFMLSLTCLLRGARWWIIPQAMYRYTVELGTLTDVQSAADLQRIRLFEDELLRRDPKVAAEPELADALRRHQAIIEHFYYYRAFTDALKAGSFAHAKNLLLESARGFGHIMTESALQAPRVAIKTLRGGFRKPWPRDRSGAAIRESL